MEPAITIVFYDTLAMKFPPFAARKLSRELIEFLKECRAAGYKC